MGEFEPEDVFVKYDIFAMKTSNDWFMSLPRSNKHRNCIRDFDDIFKTSATLGGASIGV